MSNLYKEEVLDHFNNPQNYGELEQFTNSSRQSNPFCGDDIELFVNVRDEKIESISFTGKGCAISIAAASIMTEHVKHKTVKELKDFSEKDMLDLLGVDVSETRKKCALLTLAVLQDCLK